MPPGMRTGTAVLYKVGCTYFVHSRDMVYIRDRSAIQAIIMDILHTM